MRAASFLRRSAPKFAGLAAAAAGTFLMSEKMPVSHAQAKAPEPEYVPMDKLPVLKDQVLFMSTAPNVPPPVSRSFPAKLVVNLNTVIKRAKLESGKDYDYWTFNGSVPGPMIRCRVGDVIEVHHKNFDPTGMGHNIDFHAAIGPGGGASLLYSEKDQEKIGSFRMTQPGLYVFHCAAAPVPAHIANGMYGAVLVEPEEGLPKVDKEFFVVQSEFYTEQSATDSNLLEFDYQRGLDEKPTHVVFNGKVNALIDHPLVTHQGDKVRLYVANAGPNLISSFHIIGTIFDKVYREGDLISPPAQSIQTTLIPAGGVAAVEIQALVPGNFTLVDHSIFRIEKGAIGFLKVLGKDPKKEITVSQEPPENCPNCKLH